MSVHTFGHIDDSPVVQIEIASKAGAQAKILSWGAVLRDLVVPTASGPQRVTLGLNSIEDYLAHSPSFGAVPGRFANRIANGRFTLDGVAYQLARKPGDKHTLHGGPKGFGKRVWKLGEHGETFVDADARIARRRSRISGQSHRRLRLSDARARYAASRTDGDLRRADRRST